MRSSGMRVLVALGLIVLFALTAACGGSAPEARAPGGDGADASRVGSSAPDLTGDTARASTTSTAATTSTSSTSSTSAGTPEPPKTTAVSSADNGSDIIPPFSAGKDPATKKVTPTKASKKTAGKKPKKKAAGA